MDDVALADRGQSDGPRSHTRTQDLLPARAYERSPLAESRPPCPGGRDDGGRRYTGIWERGPPARIMIKRAVTTLKRAGGPRSQGPSPERRAGRIAADGPAQAGDVVAGRHLDQRRRGHPALGDRIGAARVEVAAGRRLAGLGTSPCTMSACAGGAAWDRARCAADEQRLGVGMQRLREQRALVRELDDAAEIHHRDAVADVAHHARGRG